MRLSVQIVSLVATLTFASCGTAVAGVGGRPMLDLGSHASTDTATNQTPSASAITQHGGCAIPGLDETVTGSGNVVVNQNGTNFNCHGELPATTPPPDQPVTVDLGDCTTKVTPSGKAKTNCHSKP